MRYGIFLSYLEHKDSQTEYRNPFRGFDEEKSRAARLTWIQKEQTRIKQRKMRLLKKKKEEEKKKKKKEEKSKKKKKKEKKSKKKMVVKKQKRKRRGISGKVRRRKKLIPKKKKAFNNDRRLEMEVDSFSEREILEKTIPLKGGALLFRNRADRTMVLKDNID